MTTQTPVLKADTAAADRLLKAAVKRVATMTRDGDDPRPMLEHAGFAAELLIGGAP